MTMEVIEQLLMIKRGLAVEETVLAGSLEHGEECWLSNGTKGFVFGKVDLVASAYNSRKHEA